MTTNSAGATSELFTKGGPGGPGRPRRTVEAREFAAVLAAGFPPERIRELMENALDLAIETRSWRGVIAVCEFAAGYTLGKPKQQVQATGAMPLADMLAGINTDKPLFGDAA